MRPRFPLITFLGKKRTTTVRLKHNVNHFFLLIRFFLSFSLTSCCGQRAKEGPLTKKAFHFDWNRFTVLIYREKSSSKKYNPRRCCCCCTGKNIGIKSSLFSPSLILAFTNICHYYELICQENKSER
jgi:hypothetical protein